jgi:sn-glycerol 3-phosphate transport system permease protein
VVKRAHFKHKFLPYLLLLPQLAVTAIFFLWPAGRAIYQSFLREDIWGFSAEFVWFENYVRIFNDPLYIQSFTTTIIFSVAVAFLSLAFGLLLAAAADWVVRGTNAYRGMIMWPYAVAPAVAGALWYFLFNPSLGIVAFFLDALGYDWNHYIRGIDALILVIIASAWKQVGYNFLFFLAGMQAIPKSLVEAAAIDGATPIRRFWSIVFPLLAPITFFLIVINSVYAFFETFGVIHATTDGGPVQATSILVFKVFKTGFEGQDLGSSSAQSVVLMAIVIVLAIVQFRYLDRRVNY